MFFPTRPPALPLSKLKKKKKVTKHGLQLIPIMKIKGYLRDILPHSNSSYLWEVTFWMSLGLSLFFFYLFVFSKLSTMNYIG